MAYIDTVAHHTASAAESAGDPVWIDDGDVRSVEGLGFTQFIMPAIALATQAATAGLQLSFARKDAKAARDAASQQAAEAKKAAAASQRMQEQVTAAQIEQMKQQDRPLLDKVGLTSSGSKLAAVGGSLAVVALVGYLLLRRKGK